MYNGGSYPISENPGEQALAWLQTRNPTVSSVRFYRFIQLSFHDSTLYMHSSGPCITRSLRSNRT